nr:hypothetical protein [Tanacetum cinerariifolium]
MGGDDGSGEWEFPFPAENGPYGKVNGTAFSLPIIDGLGLLFMILDCEHFFRGLGYRNFTWVSVDVTRMYKNLWHFPVFTYTVELA